MLCRFVAAAAAAAAAASILGQITRNILKRSRFIGMILETMLVTANGIPIEVRLSMFMVDHACWLAGAGLFKKMRTLLLVSFMNCSLQWL